MHSFVRNPRNATPCIPGTDQKDLRPNLFRQILGFRYLGQILIRGLIKFSLSSLSGVESYLFASWIGWIDASVYNRLLYVEGASWATSSFGGRLSTCFYRRLLSVVRWESNNPPCPNLAADLASRFIYPCLWSHYPRETTGFPIKLPIPERGSPARGTGLLSEPNPEGP
jgi:hypothetical protein